MSVPLVAQIKCVEREISMRERLYPSWVKKGRMKAGQAQRELVHMKAVLRTLEDLAEAEEDNDQDGR